MKDVSVQREFPLVSPEIQKMIRMGIKIFAWLAVVFALVVLLGFGALFGDFEPVPLMILLAVFEFAPVLGLVMDCRDNKFVRCHAVLEDDRIRVINPEGKCLREIMYEHVTAYRVEDVTVARIGPRPGTPVKKSYICFFLNGETMILGEGTMGRNFRDKDFFMITYSQEALDAFTCYYKEFCNKNGEADKVM